MAIPSRQIGWGTEDNLLWQISKQLERLTCVTAGGCGSITTTTTSSTTAAPVYKVFTALLTQSGNYFLDQLDYSTPTQNVTKGVTYNISGDGGDFSNVGAPNNNDGTFFIAINNEIPNAWGNDAVALVYNTGAPVATVLENTIGNIWFTYIDAGFYLMRSNGLFTENKTFYQNVLINAGPDFIVFNTSPTTNEINATAGDGTIYNIPIEFRVYN